MSGRFVRASKYRHVHPKPAKKEFCFNDVRASTNGENNFIAANAKYFCYMGTGGGGPVVVRSLDSTGRVPVNPPSVNVHKSQVVDFDFSPFNDQLLATASEDCHLKVTVIPEQMDSHVTEAAVDLTGHVKKLAFVKFHPTANNVIGSSSYDNAIKVWDIEHQSEMMSFDDHPDLINSWAWSGDGSQIASFCRDKVMRVYDPRAMASCQSGPSFDGAKICRVFWADDKKWIGGVGFSRTSMREIRLWDQRKLDKPFQVTDLDQSAGVIAPFYDSDNSVLYLAGKGDGNIRYFELTEEAPYAHYLSDYRSNTPHKGCTWVDKRRCDVNNCEIALFLRLCRDHVEPVSMQVPRKSDVFQKDIYPDTYAGVPALSAKEWAGGMNKQPIKMEVKPTGFMASQAEVKGLDVSKFVVQKKKSVDELQAELNAAQKIIADQSAQIKKLQDQLAQN